MTSPRPGRLIGAIVGALFLVMAVSAARAESDPVEARAFEVHYRPLADVADLIDPLLSDEGRIILRPRLDTLIVEDRRSVLDRAQTLIEGYDLPPRNVEISFSLFLGKREGEPETPTDRFGLPSLNSGMKCSA